jgi:hypothetical protein
MSTTPYIQTDDAEIEAAYKRLDLSAVPHAFRPSIAFEAGWRAALAIQALDDGPYSPSKFACSTCGDIGCRQHP